MQRTKKREKGEEFDDNYHWCCKEDSISGRMQRRVVGRTQFAVCGTLVVSNKEQWNIAKSAKIWFKN